MPLMPIAARISAPGEIIWDFSLKNSPEIKKMGNDDIGRVCYNEDNPLMTARSHGAGRRMGRDAEQREPPDEAI